ncbi:MAG: HNH endonuclease signature motif containing protein [Dermatophilaceae bacterium]
MEQMSLEIAAEGAAASDCAGPGGGGESPSAGILDLVRGAVDICSVPAQERGVGAWMEVLTEVTQAMTVLAAARDAAVVRLAAIDEVVDEDGVVRDKVNGLGTVSLDAAAMVSIATGTSTRFGAELVEQAVTRVVRVPALHEAMLEGVLDEYKARCIAGELTDVPHELARTVVDAISGEMSAKSGPALRRRTREVLFALCPELLKERIRKSRTAVALRRWVGEPGTDSWGGSFPSERAAVAWAAIDALARRYRQEGRYDTLEQARAYALLDLVDGNTTVETVLHLTVPASAVDGGSGGAEGGGSGKDTASAEPTGAVDVPSNDATKETFVGAAGPMGSAVTWFPLRSLSSARFDRANTARRCDLETGALVDVGGGLATTSYRPGVALTGLVRQRDGRCRFPGCSVAARQCDLDHVVPWPRGSTTATNLICLCRRHHRVKQRRRWRVRLLPDGTVEWTDPRGAVVRTEPVDHLGATQTRVVDLSVDADTGTSEVVERERENDGAEIPLAMDVPTDGDLRSMAELAMSVALEHVLAADPFPEQGLGARHRTEPSGPRGSAGRGSSVGVITIEELDEVARQVRRGVFASVDEALDARDAVARGRRDGDATAPASSGSDATAPASSGSRGCLVDHRFALHVHDPHHDPLDERPHVCAVGRAHHCVIVEPDVVRGCRSAQRGTTGIVEPPPF